MAIDRSDKKIMDMPISSIAEAVRMQLEHLLHSQDLGFESYSSTVMDENMSKENSRNKEKVTQREMIQIDREVVERWYKYASRIEYENLMLRNKLTIKLRGLIVEIESSLK